MTRTARQSSSAKINSNRIFVKITVGLIVVFALASAVAMYFDQENQMMRIRAESVTLGSELTVASNRLADLQALQNIADTDEYIERIARDKLGMVKPNEIIFEDN